MADGYTSLEEMWEVARGEDDSRDLKDITLSQLRSLRKDGKRRLARVEENHRVAVQDLERLNWWSDGMTLAVVPDDAAETISLACDLEKMGYARVAPRDGVVKVELLEKGLAALDESGDLRERFARCFPDGDIWDGAKREYLT